jgi:site-specific DNA recombinase
MAATALPGMPPAGQAAALVAVLADPDRGWDAVVIGEYERAFYGARLADAGPHPNKAHAAWGRRAHRLEPDPATAPVVRWMFAQRLAGHSVARITRALNDAGIPCPSAADSKRNPHRTGTAWTLRTVAAILANPRVCGEVVT